MVQYYVWYNLGMAEFNHRFFDPLVYSPETSVLSDQIANNGKVMAIHNRSSNFDHGCILCIFGFYRLLYGILLRSGNYKELRKIDL
jgi:hypothetical protein